MQNHLLDVECVERSAGRIAQTRVLLAQARERISLSKRLKQYAEEHQRASRKLMRGPA